MENKIDERYYTKVEIPISVILETIFNTDNRDVETLSRWALKYGFVDLIEKDGKKYYKLQDDYTKQSFYIWLSEEERKQYDYEDYLIDQLQQKDNIIKNIKAQLYYLETYSSKEDVFEDMKRRLDRIEKIIDKENKYE